MRRILDLLIGVAIGWTLGVIYWNRQFILKVAIDLLADYSKKFGKFYVSREERWSFRPRKEGEPPPVGWQRWPPLHAGGQKVRPEYTRGAELVGQGMDMREAWEKIKAEDPSVGSKERLADQPMYEAFSKGVKRIRRKAAESPGI